MCRLTEEKFSSGSTTTYVLDTNNNMTESSTNQGAASYVSVFEYTDGVLSAIVDYYDEEKTSPIGKLTYKRDGDKITISRYQYDGGLKKFEEVYRKVQTVDGQDHLVREEIYNREDVELTLDVVIDYTTDARGNMISAKWFYDGNLKQTYTYEYDNKSNWKLAHQAYTVMKTSPNNMVKQIQWNTDGTIMHKDVFMYEYNLDGYPSSQDGVKYTYKCREK